ncbi:MAG: ATP-binding protein [bacterium]
MLYPRKILDKLTKWLPEKEIIILNGARQVGKTSILQLLKKDLLKIGILENRIFYLNLEEIKILEELNQDPENLLKYITQKNEKNYFFLDEIQYLDNPSNFLKHLYDKYSDKIKIIATGSSSLELKAKFQDSLAGRKVSFLINPLNFEEFLIFKNFVFLDYLNKEELPADIKNNFDSALKEYLLYGGMPAVVLRDDKELKQKLLEEYVNTYINKDIRMIGKINNISDFNGLVKILSSQIGNLLNISELSNTTNISRRDIEKYLDLLEFTFVVNKIFPFRKNIRAQITKMPKIYFFDTGIRNAILGNFLELQNRQDSGALFENFVFMELKNHDQYKIYFYRTVAQTEIDFIIEDAGLLDLIEVKYKKLGRPIDTRILKNFMGKVKDVKKARIVNLDFNYNGDNVYYTDYRLV